MQFSKLATLLASATLATAASVTFKSLDSITRTVRFTTNPSHQQIPDLVVRGNTEVYQEFPDGWQGNWYAVKQGGNIGIPGMLGEVSFSAWGAITYFDVSAIVDAGDIHNVHMMWPAKSGTPTSGCAKFHCNNAYYAPDDVQTKTTNEKDLVCTLGETNSTIIASRSADDEEAANAPVVERAFVLGKWTPTYNPQN
ncbi:hypothetical protein B0T17DRAFT_612111 [Bombardia bombarda]|uniref:DNase1 protein n=1 Tax=Bombardia bombarda TaxID=252184 RepID=A0AA39XJL0_9PEZI|nr:hypothetical protein B0T17DRAFT_612111 [Bombardia bombarda]